MRIEYTPRYLKDYADIKDARAKKETDKVERIIGAANNFMELHKMLDIKKYPDLGGYRIRYSGKPEWRIRFELVDDLQTKEKVVKLQIVLPREKYQKFAHKPVNESIEKNTKIIITEKQLTMLKNTKIIKLTESQLKDIVVQKIMEQSDWRDKVLYKQPNIKRELGLEEPEDNTPFPMKRDWWKQIVNIDKDEVGVGSNNDIAWFITKDKKYFANFEPKGAFYFSDYKEDNKINSLTGTWVPNNFGGVTVTLKDGRILTYTPQGGRAPKITGGKPKYAKVSFTLDDVTSGKSVLKKGMSGPVVGELQKIMLELNMKISKTGKVDNVFGPIMDLSVRQFQATNMPTGSKDGKVGKNTLNRMIEVRDYDGSEEEPEVDDSGANDTNQMIEV